MQVSMWVCLTGECCSMCKCVPCVASPLELHRSRVGRVYGREGGLHSGVRQYLAWLEIQARVSLLHALLEWPSMFLKDWSTSLLWLTAHGVDRWPTLV